jgi:predicted 3-demethylubiquinone-9 3-methyltransferase (glyoxalase superfamily)
MGSGERPITGVLNHEVPIQQCGWRKDKFGVSWQVWPHLVPELLTSSDPEKVGKAMAAMLKMKKLDVAEIRRAAA